MGADHRLDPQPANAAMADRQAARVLLVEDPEVTAVVLKMPPETTLKTLYPRQHLLQLHLRISPRMKALEIPP